MKLATRLMVSFLVVGLVPACVIGMLTLHKSGQAIEESS